MTKTLKIKGMSCGHCVNAVTKELEAVIGVDKVLVNLEAKTATVEISSEAVTNAELTAAVDEAGFEIISID